MIATTSLPSLYNRTDRTYLWVEDRLTKEYLDELWKEPRIEYLVAGGSSIIKPLVDHARKHGHPNVCGLLDQDFRRSNRQKWVPARREPAVCVMDYHEVENFLLDEDALASIPENTDKVAWTAPAILAEMRTFARTSFWTLVCRKILATLDDELTANFPGKPKQGLVTDKSSALHYIQSSTVWAAQLPGKLGRLLDPAELTRLADAAEAQYQADLASGDWKRSFSGKEILVHIRTKIYPKPSSEPEVDIAKSVAQRQTQTGRVPDTLVDLLKCLVP